MRTLVTGGAPVSSPAPAHGLAIFLRYGLVKWMRTWTSPPPSLPKCRERIGDGAYQKNDLVSLLLEMAIQAATWPC